MPNQNSLITSLRVIGCVLEISLETLADALRDKITRESCDARLARLAQVAITHAQIDLRVEGKEHVPPDETFLVMSNHQSQYDIPILFGVIPGSMRMIAKTELFRIPVWGHAMKKSGFVEIDRKNHERAVASLRAAKASISSGIHVWIAPEGTRSRTGQLLPFKKGGFFLATETNTRILPVGIAGTRDVLPCNAWRSHLQQRVGVVIGEPISLLTQDQTPKDRNTLLQETRTQLVHLIQRAQELRA